MKRSNKRDEPHPCREEEERWRGGKKEVQLEEVEEKGGRKERKGGKRRGGNKRGVRESHPE